MRPAAPLAAAALILLAAQPAAGQELKPFQKAGLEACQAGASPAIRAALDEEYRLGFSMMPNEMAVRAMVEECRSDIDSIAEDLVADAEAEAEAQEAYFDSDKAMEHHRAQLAEPLRRLWGAMLPFEQAVAARNDDMSTFTTRGWDSYAGTPRHYPVMNPRHYAGEEQKIPMEMEHEILFSIPTDGAYDFDFAKVPARVDHGPALAKIDAGIAAYKAAWEKRNAEAAALRTAKYPDEKWTGMGRESKILEGKMDAWRTAADAEMSRLGAQVDALIEAHRKDMLAPMLQAVKSGRKVKL